MNVLEAISTRSSTRAYTSEPINEEELNKIIAAGLQAPTAANRQEIHFTVLKGDHPILKEIDHDLAGDKPREHNFYYEAPIVIILSAKEEFFWSPCDAGIAVENIALACQDLGLGNVILGCIKDTLRGEKKDYYSKALKFPEGYQYEVAIALGHIEKTKEPHTYTYENQVSILD